MKCDECNVDMKGAAMSELDEFKKVVSPIAYGLAYKSELGTTEYQQLYAEEDVIKYFNNKPSLTIPKSIADELNKPDALWNGMGTPFADHPEAYRAVTIRSLNYALNYNASYNWNTEVKNIEYVKENYALVSAYLAGKALGVDLVKVVDE